MTVVPCSTQRWLELAGRSVHLISYKVGESWLCRIDNVSPGVEIARSVSCTRADAELLALSKAEKRLIAHGEASDSGSL